MPVFYGFCIGIMGMRQLWRISTWTLILMAALVFSFAQAISHSASRFAPAYLKHQDAIPVIPPSLSPAQLDKLHTPLNER